MRSLQMIQWNLHELTTDNTTPRTTVLCMRLVKTYDFGGRRNWSLVKVDIRERRSKVWFENDCYPGEPVFVPRPDGIAEDDGIILSVVLDSKKGNSFLRILDAKSFE